MKDSRPSLILFIVASVLALIAKVLGFDQMLLITKPVVVPAMYYYYLQTKTRNTSVWFSINIWLFFVADMIMLLYGPEAIISIMGCCILSYLILIGFVIRDRAQITLNAFNIAFIILLLGLLSYILFTILNLSMYEISQNYVMYLCYGIVLIGLVSTAAINYLSQSTTSLLHFCLMALCMLVSDLFYSINRFIIELPVLDHVNLMAQFISYFFMVKYFNLRRVAQLKLKI